MAENLENPPFNFGIQDTMEMGTGRDLIETFLSPETVSTSPETITEITPKKEAKKTTTAETTEKVKAKEEAEKKEKAAIDKFFSGKDEEEEEEEEEDKNPKGKVVIEEKEKEKEKEEEEGGETKDKENIFSALAKDLFERGVFAKDENDEDDVVIDTAEDFLERFQYEKNRDAIGIIDKFLGKFGEDYQNAFQAIYVKGVNPKDYFGAFNNIKDFASLDLTSETNQLAVIRQTLTDQGLEGEDITKEIERLKNYGDLDTVAQRYHKVLVKKEEAKLAQLEQEAETKNQQLGAVKSQYVKNVNTVLQDKLKSKEFDGIPLNPKLAQEVQDFLITDKYRTPSGETLTEFDRTILDLKKPENHPKKVKLALLLKILEKDPTLSTIQKAGITKKTDTLFSALARQTEKTPTKTEKVTSKPTSWFGQTE